MVQAVREHDDVGDAVLEREVLRAALLVALAAHGACSRARLSGSAPISTPTARAPRRARWRTSDPSPQPTSTTTGSPAGSVSSSTSRAERVGGGGASSRTARWRAHDAARPRRRPGSACARAARAVCAEYPTAYWRGLEPDRYPDAFVRAMTAARPARRADPDRVRRQRPRPRAGARVILEAVNAAGGNASACHAQMYTMGTLLRHGDEVQKARWLPALAAGDLRLQAFGVTERDAGSETPRIATHAERTDDGWVIDGHKAWTSRALHSDLMLLLARTAAVRLGRARRRPVDVPRGPPRPGDGDHDPRDRGDGQPCDVRGLPRGSRVPADALVGEEGGASGR